MADIHKVSARVIDWAERMEDVSDAAKGKGIRRGSFGTRWLILPGRALRARDVWHLLAPGQGRDGPGEDARFRAAGGSAGPDPADHAEAGQRERQPVAEVGDAPEDRPFHELSAKTGLGETPSPRRASPPPSRR
jgi:hypothetical protein